MSGCLGLCVIIVATCFMMIGCAAPSQDAPKMRVMCFNIRCEGAPDGENEWQHRREMFFATVRAFDPDILGSQEVVGGQPQEMRNALLEYTFLGVGRDDGRAKGEMSPIMFRTARFETIASGTFWLSETPEIPGSKSWDAAITRIATWVKLRDRQSGNRELLLVNTHWDHVGEVARLRSAEMIRDFLSRNSGAAIVTGDFNCSQDDPPYRTLVNDSPGSVRLIDSYREVHPARRADEGTYHAFKGTTEDRRIDFILHTPGLRATDAEIVRTPQNGRYPSDHFPVTCVLEWK